MRKDPYDSAYNCSFPSGGQAIHFRSQWPAAGRVDRGGAEAAHRQHPHRGGLLLTQGPGKELDAPVPMRGHAEVQQSLCCQLQVYKQQPCLHHTTRNHPQQEALHQRGGANQTTKTLERSKPPRGQMPFGALGLLGEPLLFPYGEIGLEALFGVYCPWGQCMHFSSITQWAVFFFL